MAAFYGLWVSFTFGRYYNVKRICFQMLALVLIVQIQSGQSDTEPNGCVIAQKAYFLLSDFVGDAVKRKSCTKDNEKYKQLDEDAYTAAHNYCGYYKKDIRDETRQWTACLKREKAVAGPPGAPRNRNPANSWRRRGPSPWVRRRWQEPTWRAPFN